MATSNLKKNREHCESNPGRLGEKRDRYPFLEALHSLSAWSVS